MSIHLAIYHHKQYGESIYMQFSIMRYCFGIFLILLTTLLTKNHRIFKIFILGFEIHFFFFLHVPLTEKRIGRLPQNGNSTVDLCSQLQALSKVSMW